MPNFKSFSRLISNHARQNPETIGCVDLETNTHWTWLQLDQAINRLSNWLVECYGSQSGERIVSLAQNKTELLIIQHACARAGLIYVPLNWRLTPSEINTLIQDCEPRLFFCDAEYLSNDWPVETMDINTCLELSSTLSMITTTDDIDLDVAITILYTSGTSGRPKGVLLSSNNAGAGAENFIHGNQVSEKSVFLCDMPLFHTAGLFALAGVSIHAGAILLLSKGFEPKTSISRLGNRQLGITHYFTVPQMAQMLRNHPDFDSKKLQSLIVYATGGAPNPASQIAHFVNNGIEMCDGFGMSEICSTMGMPLGNTDRLISKSGSCGVLYEYSEARIVDAKKQDVNIGESGELWIKSPTVTQGYWNLPDVTAAAFEGEWFKTGDIAKRDQDGYYYLVDRKKDMFISGGENIYPAEIENVIAELSEVAQCAVIGVDDEKWGEVGHAYIAFVPGKTKTKAEIIQHCRERLAAFKVPKSVSIFEALPMTASGKFQKHLLKRAP